jgi:hypothetical protein
LSAKGRREKAFSRWRERYTLKRNFFGAIHGPELEKYFRAADLFVLPGTGGLAVQQAMAFALPVVVAQGDGNPGRPGQPGKMGCSSRRMKLLALENALKALLSNPPLLRRMGAESYRIVSEEVNIEKHGCVFCVCPPVCFSPLHNPQRVYMVYNESGKGGSLRYGDRRFGTISEQPARKGRGKILHIKSSSIRWGSSSLSRLSSILAPAKTSRS